MKLTKTLILLVFLFSAVSCQALWYPGYIHPGHTDLTDGTWLTRSIKNKAYNMGAKFFISSDHYKSLEPDEQENYLKSFSGTYRGMVLLCGAEFSGERSDGGKSHLIVFGIEDLFGFEPEEQMGDLVRQLNVLGAKTIAAHPSAYGDFYDYRFDPTVTGFSGSEFFNSNYFDDLARYLELIRQGKKVFAASGVDSHSPADPTDKLKWLHKTYVWMTSLSKASMLGALANGQTYASDNTAKFSKLNLIPGFAPKDISRPYFNFQVNFTQATKAPVAVKIYRDGVLVWKSVKVYPKGKRSISYAWRDDLTQKGIRRYVIEVEKHIVTSPITLNITAESPLGYDPTYDCFTSLETAPFTSGNWYDTSSSSYWLDENVLPVENSTFYFFSAAKIEFFIVFHNRIFYPRFWPEDSLSWRLNVYNSLGNRIISQPASMYGLSWETCYNKDQFLISSPGQYLVEVTDYNGTVILAQKTIWVD